jgi:Antirepressor regulating drug resistance, predicted signal transduction N-terminal membrane component
MLPILPSSPISIFNISFPIQLNTGILSDNSSESTSHGVIGASDQAVVSDTTAKVKSVPGYVSIQSLSPAEQTVASVSSAGSILNIAALIWLIGVGFALLYFIIVNLIVRIGLSRHGTLTDDTIITLMDECCKKLRLSRKVKILCDNRSKSPSTFGTLRPFIVVSKQTAEKADTKTLKYVFLHELTHIKRHDNVVNLILMLLEALNWFNPILWFAFCKLKDDCEISCDAMVLSALDESERREYGYAIVNVLQAMPSGLVPGTAGFAGSFTKRRIIMIARNNKSPLIWASMAIVLVLFAGCISMPAKALSFEKNSYIGVSKKVSSSAWYYYVNNKDNLKIYRCHADGSNNVKVTNVQSQSPVVVGNWIYYVNISDGQRIYKVHSDGTGNTMISFKCPCSPLTFYNGYLYFCSDFDDDSSDCGKLYRMKPDGFAQEKLCNDYAGDFKISNGNIFYCNAHDNWSLYKIRINGKSRAKISNDYIFDDFVLNGNSIYYVAHSNAKPDGKIYKMSNSGKGKQEIGTFTASQITIWKGMLYYYSADGSKLYKMNLNGTGRNQVPHHSTEETLAFGYVHMGS